MQEKIKRYTEEFKQEAVNLVTKQGYSNTEAARNLGVSESSIRQWIKKFNPELDKKELEYKKELKQLKKENEILRMEREILKKAAAFFASKNL